MRVNLFSDTQTQPTDGMRRAMASAEVGDEQRHEDPTVLALCERVAALLGQEAAVFLPTGTMCNLIAFLLHVRAGGDAVLLHPRSHPVWFEAGGPAAIARAVLMPVDGPGGMFDATALQALVSRPGDRYAPRSRLVCVEQTTNIAGGRVWPRAQFAEVVATARAHDLLLHLDGARLLNAAVASGVPAAEWAGTFDTAWIDFTKGLGAPVGACLAGSRALIDEAWRFKQMLGGAMRQAGVIAAAALYALDHHVERMADDHANARRLAEGLAELPGVGLGLESVETNIVVFEVPDARGFCARLDEAGVVMGPLGDTTVRAVTHLDVDADGIDAALGAARRVLAR